MESRETSDAPASPTAAPAPARRVLPTAPPAPPPERRASRAGRDLPAAIGVGVGLAALVLLALLVRKEGFVALTALAAAVCVFEISGAFRSRHIRVPLVPLLVGSVGMLVSAYAAGPEALLVAFGLTSLGLLVWRVLDGVDGAAQDVAAGVFAAAYVPFLAGFAMLLLAEPDGVRRIVVFVLVTIASDIGGYAAGATMGRHPMAPSVSPKKSWEGFAGSLLACAATGVTGVVVLLEGPWWAGLLVGVAACCTATLGDLSESLLKRDLGIKDMGSLLPGHGGLMDRLDSLLPTAPATWLLLTAFVPVAA